MADSTFYRLLHKIPLLLLDVVSVCAAVYLAYLIRFDFQIWPLYEDQLHNFLVIYLLVRVTSFYYLGLYRGIWRYFSLDDLILLVKAVSLGTALILTIDYFRNYAIGLATACIFALSAVLYWFSIYFSDFLWKDRKRRMLVIGIVFCFLGIILIGAIWIFQGTPPSKTSPIARIWLGEYLLSQDFLYNLGIPRSIIVLEWILCLFSVGSMHLVPRLLTDIVSRYRQRKASRVLIVGAGDAGEMMIREARKNPEFGYLPVGFIDDNLFKRNAKIHGLEVLGTREDIVRIVKEKDVDEILITIPSLQGPALRQLLSLCSQASVPVKALPGLSRLMAGSFKIDDLQPVDTNLLLGRDEVVLNLETVAEYLKGKRVLITGAGGSIGSELCRQIIDYSPEQLILLGKGENSIYEIENEMRAQYGDHISIPVIADVRDSKKLNQVFDTYRPEVIFHAAAHKHVPLMERHPDEAVKNNIFGTLNLVKLASKYDVSAFVMISTDKAVNPTSIMGVTKKVAELVVQDFAKKSNTKFVIVRFGNVIRSRGSVVPLFEKQIRSGGPVTVTHPEMTRFFMSIPEAAHLVLQGGAIADSGNICVLDMGEPVKIVDLARNLIQMAGLSPDADIQIEFTGLRPGEKLFEEILTSGENITTTKFEKIFLDESDLIDSDALSDDLHKLRECVDTNDEANMIRLLLKIVPTYTPKVGGKFSGYDINASNGS